jgi:hypothetical protein
MDFPIFGRRRQSWLQQMQANGVANLQVYGHFDYRLKAGKKPRGNSGKLNFVHLNTGASFKP